jgi:hypothetical protein
MTDLVSGVLTRISAIERLAELAAPGPWRPNAEHDEVLAVDDETVCDGFALSNNQLRNTVDHIVANDPDSILRLCRCARQIVELFPVSEPHLDTEGSFYGFQSRDCGEHRTVGPHRAWCFDCSEWCYRNAPCARCHGVHEALRILAVGLGVVEEDRNGE